MSVENLSLAGRSILITRSSEQAESTAEAVRARDATPLLLPTLEMECLHENIQASIPLLEHKKTEILFTSRNGVASVAAVLGDAFAPLLSFHSVTAVGDKTAAALAELGIQTTMQPESASQAGLIKAYKKRGAPEQLLFYRAEEGSDALANALTAAGCHVTTIHAYRMQCPDSDASEMIRKMERSEVDAVLLGSARTVYHYIQRVGSIETANTPAIAVISQQVAKAAEHAGLNVQAVAKTASFDAMLDALADYFNDSGAENHVSS
ncbi:MAG TPA: uroporphyrinogen-III synthase [Mariprofundaceae bacterium]|nr:uroporphyrinogen-III synthase [Mariprofundaceae bacterium]